MSHSKGLCRIRCLICVQRDFVLSSRSEGFGNVIVEAMMRHAGDLYRLSARSV